jgi:hypothetical protein
MRPLRYPGGTQQVMVRLPKVQYDALQAISTETGIAMAEQFRRAVTGYLDAHPLMKGQRASLKAGLKAPKRRVSLRPKHAISE